LTAQALQIRLDELLELLPAWFRSGLTISGEGLPWIGGIAQDSRRVVPGDLFVARQGNLSDGHAFIPDALNRGASVIVGERQISSLPVPYIRVKDGRLALAYFAAAVYRFPARKLIVIGVTGTDGKTTTCNLIFNILKAAGYPVGMISTVNAVIGDKQIDTGFHVTTPDAPDVQRYLAEMVQQDLTHVILEVTSHGLEQQRVAGCDFDLAVLTNITHEHIDYHGTFEAYRKAKARLFTGLTRSEPKASGLRPGAVLNRDDRSFAFISNRIRAQAMEDKKEVHEITYGFDSSADVCTKEIVSDPGGMDLKVLARGEQLNIRSRLLGDFNAANVMAAAAATFVGLNVASRPVLEGIESTQGIPGRMELVDMGQPFRAMVDFAHTPNALKRVLEAARKLLERSTQPGKIIAIFGSAGLRDRDKRRLMAEESLRLADVTILTAEDPRIEALAEILGEMSQGAQAAGGVEGENYWCIPDRREAIRFGVKVAQPGDIVLALGKGHEQSMCFGEREYPWDDRIALKAALAEILQVVGPKMPFLPDWA